MQNKSEELCKLLGIKPSEEKDCICVKGHKSPKTCLTNKNCLGCQYNCRANLPDLAKPINFMKLLEMLVIGNKFDVGLGPNEIIIEGMEFYLPKAKSITEVVITGFISFLECEIEENGNNIEFIQDFDRTYKQQAQQTEWDY